MDALELAEHFIADSPLDPDAGVLNRLLHALRADQTFCLQDLYELRLSSFELALEVMGAWRLQRYYRGEAVTAAAGSGRH